jgi:hypothetical protein
LLFLSLVAVAAGCFPWPQQDLAARRKAMRADEWFSGRSEVQLAEAVERGDSTAIADAVRSGADVNGSSREGMNMLVWAAVKGSVPGFKALLVHGADLTVRIKDPVRLDRGQWTETTIETISCETNKSFLQAALEQGFDPNHVLEPKDGETLLYRLVWNHNLEAAGILIDGGADVNWQNAEGITPLKQAQLIGDYKMVVFLHSRGGDLMLKDRWGYDVAESIKQYGTRGVRPDQREYFEKVVAELIERGLLTRQDIVEADKPKRSALDDGPPGVTVIEHSPDSEAGQAILEMDRKEREANERDRR